MPLIPSDYASLIGSPILQADETADDSDKSFTVPAGKMWELTSIWVELTSTASAGNRQMTIEIQDSGSDVVMAVAAGAVQAQSLTRNYMFAPHMPDLTSFRAGDLLMTPMPPLLLSAGFIIRVYDSAAIAAAADDMIVQMLVNQRIAI